MKFLDNIATALAGKGRSAPTAARLGELVAEAEREAEAARARLVELEGQRSARILAGEAAAHRAELTTARDDAEYLDAAAVALRERRAAALAAEADTKRRKAYEAAEARAGELAGLIVEYERAAKAVRDVVRRVAEIDAVVVAANADLPDGAAAIPTSDVLRSIPGTAHEVISEKTVDLWCSSGSTDALGAEYQDRVSDSGNGRGMLRTSSGTTSVDCVRRRFTRREVRDAVRTVHASSFGEIRLPAARAGQEPVFWPPVISQQTRDILAAVDMHVVAEAAQRPASTGRPVVIEHQWKRDAA